MKLHPLSIFKYCPKCGSEFFIENSTNSKKCQVCGFEYFKNPVIGVAALIFNNKGEVLCLTREREPAKGTLAFPGGFVDINEKIEGAVIREVKEETNLDIKIDRLITNIPNQYQYCGMEQFPLDFYFIASVKDFEKVSSQKEEVSNIHFVKLENINISDFGMPSTRIFLKDFLSGKHNIL